jgi:hypothetical protein
MNETQLAQAILLGELKTLQSVAKRMPRQDGSGIGVNSGTLWQWMERGNLTLPQVLIDGERFFYVSAADQLKADWELQAKLVKRHRRGRPSAAEYLGFVPKG